MRVLLKALVGCLLLATAALTAPAWKPFRSSVARFSAAFPAPPRLTSSQTDSPIGAVTTQIYTGTSAWGTYSVACTELPGAAVRFASERVISDTREGILHDAGAQQQSWSPVDGGYELAYRSSQKQGWSQVFLVGTRLYVLDVRVKPGTDKAVWVTPFFAKFAAQKD